MSCLSTTQYAIREYKHNGESKKVKLAYKLYSTDLQVKRKKTPLVMIMGWTGVKEDWAGLDIALSASRPVLIFDNRGIGESEIPEETYSIQMMAEDALFLMNVVEKILPYTINKWHIMGISMGGMIAQTLAVIAHHRVKSLILGCTTHGGPTAVPADKKLFRPIRQAYKKQLRNAMKPQQNRSHDINTRNKAKLEIAKLMWAINFTPEWVEVNKPMFYSYVKAAMGHRRSIRGIMSQLVGITQFDVKDHISNIKAPTLIIHGTKDNLLPYANGQSIASQIKTSQLYTLEGAGHLFWYMRFHETSTKIDEFISNQDGEVTSWKENVNLYFKSAM